MSDKYDLARAWLVNGPFPRLSQAMTRHDNAQRLLACSLSRTSLILRGSRRRLRQAVSIRISALS